MLLPGYASQLITVTAATKSQSPECTNQSSRFTVTQILSVELIQSMFAGEVQSKYASQTSELQFAASSSNTALIGQIGRSTNIKPIPAEQRVSVRIICLTRIKYGPNTAREYRHQYKHVSSSNAVVHLIRQRLSIVFAIGLIAMRSNHKAAH